MNRIEKFVQRGKAELALFDKNESWTVFKEHSSVSTPAISKDFTYTQTERIDLDLSKLVDNKIVALDEKSANSNKFKILRTKVLQQMRKHNWNTLGISAPLDGAGKSFTSINLATSIAMEGKQSVLLVDMDLNKPSIHSYFNIQPEHGIFDVLTSSCSIKDALIKPNIERLVLLPGRPSSLISAESFSPHLIEPLVKELKNRYSDRVIVFDLPSVLSTDKVMSFLPNIDCSLLVIESGKNTKSDIENSLNILNESPILGTVLNKTSSFTKARF